MDEVSGSAGTPGRAPGPHHRATGAFYEQAATGPRIKQVRGTAIIAFNHEENFARTEALAGQLFKPGIVRADPRLCPVIFCPSTGPCF